MELSFKTVTLSDYRSYMKPHWPFLETAQSGNGVPFRFASARYGGIETLNRMLIFPIAAMNDSEIAGAMMTYNISDTSVHLFGIYVSEKYRGRGLMNSMLQYSFNLWPKPWSTCLGNFRESSAEIFLKKGWRPLPGARFRSCRHGLTDLPYKAITLYKPLREGQSL